MRSEGTTGATRWLQIVVARETGSSTLIKLGRGGVVGARPVRRMTAMVAPDRPSVRFFRPRGVFAN